MEVLEQLKDLMECCVCRDTYKDPKILPCIHTFCRTCLEELGCKSSKCPGENMSCPICRQEFTIPIAGYAALQKNFFMEKLMETADVRRSNDGPDRCENCMKKESKLASASEVSLANMYCADCRRMLCKKCSSYHKRNKSTKTHAIVAAADFKRKVQVIEPSICNRHKRIFDLYCSDCKELICKSCFGQIHQNHRLQNAVIVVAGFINEIKEILSGVEVCMSEVLEKKALKNCAMEQYCNSLERLKPEVLKQTDLTIKLVHEHTNLLMQEIDQLKELKKKEVLSHIEDRDEDFACLESFKVYCTWVVTKGSVSDICGTIDELRAKFSDIKKAPKSDTEIKTYYPNIAFQMADLVEFVKIGGYNIVGTIQECNTGVEEREEAINASGTTSHDGYRKVESRRGRPTSGQNGILAEISHLKQELENKQRRICELEIEKKAFEKRINERDLELGIKRPLKSASRLSITGVQQPRPRRHAIRICNGKPGIIMSLPQKDSNNTASSATCKPAVAGGEKPNVARVSPVDSGFSHGYRPAWSPQRAMPSKSPTASPPYMVTSPKHSPGSPSYSSTSSTCTSPCLTYSPMSPGWLPASPRAPSSTPGTPKYSPNSPAYTPTSPWSPQCSPYGPPWYSPNSPSYTITSPSDLPASSEIATSPTYIPFSP